MPRRNYAEVLIGAIVLLVAAGFLAYAVAHSGRTATSGYQLYAKFDQIGGLSVGSDVRIAGVKVGNVDSATIDPTTYQAVVGFTVRSDIKLPKDSSAVITSESLLGGNYLALSPGGDEAMLQPGQTVTITQGSINIEELLGKFIFSASNLASSTAKGGAPGGGAAGDALPPLGGQPAGQDKGGQAKDGQAKDGQGGGLSPLGGQTGGAASGKSP